MLNITSGPVDNEKMSNNILGFLNNNNKQKNLNLTIKDFFGRKLSLLCDKHAIP